MIGTGAAKLSRTARGTPSERHELPEVVVGKDVLELVSSAMYIDPMTIYREYIQNAADSIDEARATGLIETDASGRVDIEVHAPTRAVRIRDYGCGVPFKDFGRKLAALGGSAKRGTRARGFRGVGRLAGLGYAQELVFRSRSAGESKVSVLRWDCRQLKAALRNPNQNTGVIDVIRDVTTL
jgi:HSP90 family molecular chaperone